MKIGRSFPWLLGWALLCLWTRAGAHPALFTSAEIYIQPDGRYQFFTTFDLLAFALHKTSVDIGDPPMNALLDGPPEILNARIEEAQAYFRERTKLQTDQGPATVTRLKFPTLQDVEDWKASGRIPRLPVVARVEMDGALPATASTVQFQFPVTLGTVVLTLNRPTDDVYDGMIDPGFPSSSISIRLDRSGESDARPAHAEPPVGPHPTRSGSARFIAGAIGCLCFFLLILRAARLLKTRSGVSAGSK